MIITLNSIRKKCFKNHWMEKKQGCSCCSCSSSIKLGLAKYTRVAVVVNRWLTHSFMASVIVPTPRTSQRRNGWPTRGRKLRSVSWGIHVRLRNLLINFVAWLRMSIFVFEISPGLFTVLEEQFFPNFQIAHVRCSICHILKLERYRED